MNPPPEHPSAPPVRPRLPQLQHLARLARLAPPADPELIADIIEFIATLFDVPLTDAAEDQAQGSAPLRPDEVRSSTTAAAIVAAAPGQRRGLLCVPRILD